MEEIKLLALDMDGTAYYKMGEIVPSNLQPIREAIAKGVEVVILTGRPALARQNKLKENGLASQSTVLVSYNGGCIYHLESNTVLQANPIESILAKQFFQLAQEPRFKGTVVWGYVDDFQTVITNTSNPNLKEEKIDAYLEEMNFFDGQYLEFENVSDQFDYNFFKLLIFNAQLGFLEVLEKLGVEVASGDLVNAEVNAPGINKKYALQWLKKELKISQKNMMAIGDGANDLAMIEYAGVGVAMKNSLPAIKEIANVYVDLTNEQGAVGYAIEKYILKKDRRSYES